jgi:hypothetical protein
VDTDRRGLATTRCEDTARRTLSATPLHDPLLKDDPLGEAYFVNFTDFLTPDSLLLGTTGSDQRDLLKSRPSFFDLWFGNPRREYRSDDGTLLRVEDRRATEARYLGGLAEATWTTFRIATLGSLLGALLALPLGLVSARNLAAPRPLAWAAKGVLDVARAIHTLVFGLVLVGIVGLGPTAGILAIGLHSMGTYGKLFAEGVEALDMRAIEAVRATGAGIRRSDKPDEWAYISKYSLPEHDPRRSCPRCCSRPRRVTTACIRATPGWQRS